MDALSEVLFYGFKDGRLIFVAINLISLAYVAIPVLAVLSWPIIGTTAVAQTMRALFGWIPGLARERATDFQKTVLKKPPTDTHGE